MKKIRLDSYLADRGLSASREKAKREIVAGWVTVDGETVREPARTLRGDESVRVSRPAGLYVSRGGEKLARALAVFAIDVRGLRAVDLGASTGGFTDCLLKHGAARVFAIDVGYGQLDYGLRTDRRVVVMERTNARNLTPEAFDGAIDFVVADLSFISIVKVFDTITALFPDAAGVVLVKPQFEAGPGEQKKGVVRKPEHHAAILRRVLRALAEKGLRIRGLTYSPLRGPAGNIEFLLYYAIGAAPAPGDDAPVDELVARTVAEAHAALADRRDGDLEGAVAPSDE